MRTVVAILALTPALAFAQSKSPAQPESTPVLQSKLAQPVSPMKLNSAVHTATVTSPVAVTTGVTAPRLLQTISRIDSPSEFSVTTSQPRSVVVGFTVDERGVPQNVSLQTASDPYTKNSVIAAVQKMRYAPGKVNGVAVAVPVELTVHILPE